jgi:hypothetical protein
LALELRRAKITEGLLLFTVGSMHRPRRRIAPLHRCFQRHKCAPRFERFAGRISDEQLRPRIQDDRDMDSGPVDQCRKVAAAAMQIADMSVCAAGLGARRSPSIALAEGSASSISAVPM